MHKIVLTGGPCGGKTTALARITDHFASLGYHVLRVPEAATMFIIGGGLTPYVDRVSFQTELLKAQQALEAGFVALAQQMTERTSKEAIILCDRGTMDAAAYMEKHEWQAVLDANRWSTVDLRDRNYSAVVHLVTAAVGAIEAYTTANNSARTETAEQAAALDARTMAAWVGHPHLRVIDNCTDFNKKITRTINAICRVVGVPEPIEDERKYLVQTISEIPVPFQDVEIEQVYLTREGERIRRRGQNGVNIYFHTIKRNLGGSRRTEIERQITPRDYVAMLGHAHPMLLPIYKTRRCFVWEGQYFELDIFHGHREGLVMMEAELDEGQSHVPLPPFIKIERDVTDDPQFTNRQLALSLPRGGSDH